MLALEIAAGYALGRLLAHTGSLLSTVVMRRILEHNATWRRLVREDAKRDLRLKEQLSKETAAEDDLAEAYRRHAERQRQ